MPLHDNHSNGIERANGVLDARAAVNDVFDLEFEFETVLVADKRMGARKHLSSN